MTTHGSVPSINMLDVQVVAPALQLSEVAQTAQTAMENAIIYCVDKIGAPSAEAAVSRLRMGDSVAGGYWRYGLAQQAAQYLSDMDADVKAVYLAEYDATPEDMAFSEIRPASLIHLIVWTTRKTAALSALSEGLDRALAAECAARLDLDKLTHLLDVQFVDDAEVAARAGYGALLASAQHKPLQIWQRR